MTTEEKRYAKIISRIIRSARKQCNLTQEEVAEQLGISQSALSKLEHGTLIPSAPQWFSFCDLTQIPYESLRTGWIDRLRPAQLEDSLKEGSFKLPRRYAIQRGSKIRAFQPLLRLFRDKLGEEKLQAYLKSVKLDSDYFVDLDLQLHIEAFLDMSRALITEGAISSQNLSDLNQLARNPEMHGNLAKVYEQQPDSDAVLKSFVDSLPYYSCNFKFSPETLGKGRYTLVVQPAEHLDSKRLIDDEVLGDFFWQYIGSYLQQIPSVGRQGVPGQSAQVTFRLEKTRKPLQAIYQIVLPSASGSSSSAA